MGLLVAGGVTSKLLLVYVAIALSVVALIFLVTGAILHREEFRAQPSGETAGTAAGTAAGGDAQAVEAESPALAGAASASGALAGRAPAAGSGAAAEDTASAARTGKPPWPDAPPPAGLDRWAAFERIADRRRPGVPWPGDRRDRPGVPAGPGGPGEPGGHGGGPEEQWPGKRLPDEIQLHAPWPAQDWSAGRGPAKPRPPEEGPADERWAAPAPATFDWLTPDRSPKSGAPETGAPNPPREQPPAGQETEAIADPRPAASAEPKTEALTGPPTGDSRPAEPEAAEREAVEPEAVEPEAVEPEAVEPEAAEPEAAEPEAVEPEVPEPQAAKPEPAGRGSGEPVHAEAEPSDRAVTVVPGVPRYHRSDCILIRFMGDKDLQRMPAEAAKEAGCTPCRACQPDGEDVD